MESSRFDAWTRRRFGLAVGGGAAALLGLSQLDDADAKKKKKRCKKIKQACKAKGKKKRCCKKLTCGTSVAIPEGTHCCRKAPGTCTDATECCAPALCDDGACCFLAGDGPCTSDEQCCDFGVCNTDTGECGPPV